MSHGATSSRPQSAPPSRLQSRLQQQLDFLTEIDKLKHILRRTYLLDGSRRENDAEHSWHLSMYALVLMEYAPGHLDLLKVLKMVLVHDLVEIDAGDTFVYDVAGYTHKANREAQAADRLFALLPAEQGSELRTMWEEFENRQSPEAKFAAAIDRLQPLLHNHRTGGRTWREHGVTADQVRRVNAHIVEGAPELWAFVETLIDDAVRRGFLPE